jgi:GxxExxY protein
LREEGFLTEGQRARRFCLRTVFGERLEIKSCAKIEPVFEKQPGTYLKLSGKPCGLLFNFNETRLVSGIRRILNGYPKE